MDAFEEQLEIATRSWQDGAFSFSGEHFTVEALDAQPKPVQRPMPLVIGGSGGPRSLRIAARWASEYNTVFTDAAGMAELRGKLDAACAKADRDPATLPLSVMTGWIVGERREEVVDRAARLSEWQGKGGDGEAFLAKAAGSLDHRHRRGGGRAAARPARGRLHAGDGPEPSAPRHRGDRADRPRGRTPHRKVLRDALHQVRADRHGRLGHLPRLHVLRRRPAAATTSGRCPRPRAARSSSAALDAGINFFDTANVYSARHRARRSPARRSPTWRNRDEIVLATKVHGQMREGPNGGGLSRKAILSEIDHSLRAARHRLRRPLPDPPLGLRRRRSRRRSRR